MINFIGIGAQKSGTSWVYACLYEHPEICAPIKEIHFFSRERYALGQSWYESHFVHCNGAQICGEFSTSYLYSPEAPKRIQNLYPAVKLIAILRNPIERAYSQYRNAIKAGEISKTMDFEAYISQEERVSRQGLYTEQLERFYEYFHKSQVLVLVYEDIQRDPGVFIKRIFKFLNVDDAFVPSMLHSQINVARTPKIIYIERVMHMIAEFLRRHNFGKIVHMVRRIGAPDIVRNINTEQEKKVHINHATRQALSQCVRADVEKLSVLLGRDMNREWNI